MEDDLQQEEQIKKKKRLVLFMLLALLVVTAGAATLLEPAVPTPVAARGTSPTPPKQRVTPVTPVFTVTPSPSPVQGDEWNQPTLPASGDSATLRPVGTLENDNTASSPGLTSTAESQPEAEGGPTRTKPSLTPTLNDTSEHTIPELAISPTAKTSTPAGTSIAEAPPAVNPAESNERLTATPAQQSEPPLVNNKATPSPTEISKRINESWDILDGSYISTAEAINPSPPLPATPMLTSSTSLSQTVTVVPPDGLPVTGIISRHEMNWAALMVVVLLVGAGVVALFDPRKRPN